MGSEALPQAERRRRGGWAFPSSGIVLFIVAVPIFLPLSIAGVIRSTFLCSGPENSPQRILGDTLYGYVDPNPVCAAGDAWLYAGAPVLTFALVGLIAVFLIAMYRWPRPMIFSIALCIAALPWPYLWLFASTGELM